MTCGIRWAESSSCGSLRSPFLFDTGLLRWHRELGMPPIDLIGTRTPATRGPLGGILENQVAIEITRLGLPLCGWKKTPSGGEIDFLMPQGDRIVPVECKAGLAIDRRSLRGMADYLDAYDQPAGVIVGFAPLAALELESRQARGSRRVTLLPATLLERLPRVMGTGPP